MTVVTDKPRFRALVPSPDGVVDRRGKVVFCDRGDGELAVWSGEWRPASRIMFYPFDWCAQCFDAARRGQLRR